MEKFSDAVTRNLLICTAIMEPEKGAMIIGGRFGFGEHVLEIAGKFDSKELAWSWWVWSES
jgi:hypothetical protein